MLQNISSKGEKFIKNYMCVRARVRVRVPVPVSAPVSVSVSVYVSVSVSVSVFPSVSVFLCIYEQEFRGMLPPFTASNRESCGTNSVVACLVAAHAIGMEGDVEPLALWLSAL